MACVKTVVVVVEECTEPRLYDVGTESECSLVDLRATSGVWYYLVPSVRRYDIGEEVEVESHDHETGLNW